MFGEAGPEAVIPLHRLPGLMRSMQGAGGPSVSVNIGSIGSGAGDLSPDEFGATVGAAVARQIREDGGMRSLLKRAVRGGL